ncbi:mandelate racemase [Microlunatus endophyticus]|uniref:Mandelate racemase n=1 Tax=Microlunatus endophyticus TaxID=1716077 RepID=A0A917W5Y3_9ACTN|nr:mandelate racemase/muconate lactonizing enzyme family protein [Microlunatus endophyticus]GGL73314.1 mandelate racemase [Microlunatus endophyticus]
MNIDSVDFFYASMPSVTYDADGSQDTLLVRVRSGSDEGWGECEASPLTSIAAFVTPRSHGVCQPVADSVLGERLDSVDDIARIAALVRRNSMDLLQAPHTFSGIEIALWDLLGRRLGEPVWRLLGGRRAYPKVPYASMLFGATAQQTLDAVKSAADAGFRAVKVGWGTFGQGSVDADADQLAAAREGLGSDGFLLVDAGQIWVDDVAAAAQRLPALEAAGATWIEEPFLPLAYRAHAELAGRSGTVGVAGGEGAHSVHMATNLIDYADVRFVQIDTGRIGGIGPAKAVADYAAARDIAFVNHTFTSQLALSASLQPFAALPDHRICEFPLTPSELARKITAGRLELVDGELLPLDAPGLGLDVELEAIRPYLHDVEISIDGHALYAGEHFGGTR